MVYERYNSPIQCSPANAQYNLWGHLDACISMRGAYIERSPYRQVEEKKIDPGPTKLEAPPYSWQYLETDLVTLSLVVS